MYCGLSENPFLGQMGFICGWQWQFWGLTHPAQWSLSMVRSDVQRVPPSLALIHTHPSLISLGCIFITHTTQLTGLLLRSTTTLAVHFKPRLFNSIEVRTIQRLCSQFQETCAIYAVITQLQATEPSSCQSAVNWVSELSLRQLNNDNDGIIKWIYHIIPQVLNICGSQPWGFFLYLAQEIWNASALKIQKTVSATAEVS